MSPAAIARRLQVAKGLYELGISLGKAKHIGPVAEEPEAPGVSPSSDELLNSK